MTTYQEGPLAVPAAGLAALADLPDDAMIAVEAVSQLCAWSTRHTWRMVDAGGMPAPRRVGRLCRWRIGDIKEWIRQGCKPVRPHQRGPSRQAGRA
jgi:predicted DNA-binding transcriptional regulator AlpA